MNNLERMRRRKGLTRKELAFETKIPYPTLASWENGSRSLTNIEHLLKIAKVLECDVVDLLEGQE